MLSHNGQPTGRCARPDTVLQRSKQARSQAAPLSSFSGICSLLVLVLALSACTYTEAAMAAEQGSPVHAATTAPYTSQPQNNSTSLDNLQIIFTIDPNFQGCFEAVTVNDFTRHTVLAYIRELKDILTATRNKPSGDDLGIPSDYAVDGADTYKLRIDAALAKADDKANQTPTVVELPSMLLAAYQMTQLPDASSAKGVGRTKGSLPSKNLHFTTSDSFWHAAEISAGTASLQNVRPNSTSRHYEAYQINSIAGSLLFLPRWTPLVNSMDDEAKAVTGYFGVPARDWSPGTLLHIVSTFINMTQIKTVPDLSEWAANADKTQLQVFYEAYYREAPDKRTPPLETAHVVVPMDREEAYKQCWKDGIDANPPSEIDIQNTMQEIFEGLQRLHAEAPLGSTGRLLAEDPDEEAGGTAYVLKRNYAEAAYGMTKFNFPDHLLSAPHEFRPWLARNEVQNGSVLTTSNTAPPQILREVAVHLIKAGCGLPWLLQFKIALFETSEYRVYLLGGANALDKDIHVVYSPAFFSATRSRLAMIYLTVKPGQLINVLLPPYEGPDEGETSHVALDATSELPQMRKETLVEKDWQEWEQVLRPRPSPRIYELLVSAARDGARALQGRRMPDGSSLHSVNELFTRVDILLAIPWNETRGGREVVARINEMDWVNSAAVMTNLWDDSQAAQEAAMKLCSQSASANAPSTCDSGIASSTMQTMAARVMRLWRDMAARMMPLRQGMAARTASSKPCAAASVELLKQAMQQAQGSSPAFVLAEAMLRRAIATMQ